MVVMKHSPGPRGWEFEAEFGRIVGGGRTLEESIETSEHATRTYLSKQLGYEVQMTEAIVMTRHVTSD